MGSRKYGSRVVEVTNEDKVLFADDGITKGEVIDYYEQVADRILPYLKGRPLVLQRFPNGIASPGFYQKQIGGHFPDWIKTIEVEKHNGSQTLVVCDDRATLVYLANQAAIVLHPWLSRAERIHQPDLFVLDLDPPSGEFDQVRSAAQHCKALFDELEFPVFVKTTGSKGLHLVFALSAKETFDEVRAVAREMMDVLSARHPDELTTEQRKQKRRGRIYLDVARNAYAQTAVAPWSLRALPGAPVSTPVAWSELAKPGFHSRSFTVRNVLRRTGKDPWTDLRRLKCSMSTLQKRLRRIA